MKVNYFRLIFSIAVCQAAGLIGTVFTLPSIRTWYAALAKPAFSPPNWLFGPVWTILYAMMGVSLYLIWQKGLKSKKTRLAMMFFGVQLVVNALWSIVFFGMRSAGGALGVIVVLWILILITLRKFAEISPTSGKLLYPYLAWVSFAAVLNFEIFRLNPN